MLFSRVNPKNIISSLENNVTTVNTMNPLLKNIQETIESFGGI